MIDLAAENESVMENVRDKAWVTVALSVGDPLSESVRLSLLVGVAEYDGDVLLLTRAVGDDVEDFSTVGVGDVLGESVEDHVDDGECECDSVGEMVLECGGDSVVDMERSIERVME